MNTDSLRNELLAQMAEGRKKQAANEKYVLDQIQRIATPNISTFCHSTYRQAQIFYQLGIAAVLTASSDEDTLTRMMLVQKTMEGQYGALQATTTKIVLREMIHDKNVSDQVYNMLAELINRDKKMLAQTMVELIERVQEVREKKKAGGS